MDIAKLEQFIDSGITIHKEYLSATQKQLDVNESKDEAADERYIRLVISESYYSGALDSLENIKLYLQMFKIEDSNAQTDN